MLAEFGPGIWIGEGPVVPFYGFAYPTRMAVIGDVPVDVEIGGQALLTLGR